MSQTSNHITKVALVGATGTLGSHILSGLLAQSNPHFSITLLTRVGSITPATHPELTSNPRITIAAGSYTDHAFLVSTLTSQDALIITLGWMAQHQIEEGLIRAACEAQVPYILPCEFGSDSSHPPLLEAIPVQHHKSNMRKLVEELGVQQCTDGGERTRTSSWIGIINNAWYDWSLAGGWFGIDIKARKATLFGNDTVKAYLTTIGTSGLAAARVLSLPLTLDASASNVKEQRRTLPSFANKMVYIRNFHLTQREIFDAVQRATHTTDADWAITRVPTATYIAEGHERLARGDHLGIMNLLYGNIFTEGVANEYFDGDAQQHKGELSKKSEEDLDTAVLGLEGCEDLDEVTARVVREVMAT